MICSLKAHLDTWGSQCQKKRVVLLPAKFVASETEVAFGAAPDR